MAWALAAAAALVLGLPAAAYAQRGQDGEIAGAVADTSGAALADAVIAAIGPHGPARPTTVRSDGSGRYRIPGLPPGTYVIEASRAGFATVRRPQVAVPPGLALTVDFILPVARVEQVVDVVAAVPAIDVRSAAAPTMIERRLLDELPLGRSVATYVSLAPGVPREAGLGGARFGNPMTLDGASANEPGLGAAAIPLTRTWTEEVQIVAAGADARYGEFTGVLVNAITRSGTDAFAGLAETWFTRPDWTDSNGAGLSADQAAQFRPAEVIERWEGIGQAGGPLRRGRAWFFAGAVRHRDATRSTAFSATPRTDDEPYPHLNESRGIAKITVAPAAPLRLDATFTHTRSTVRNVNAGPLVAPEAVGLNVGTYDLWNARGTWAAPGWLVDVRAGSNRVDLETGAPAGRRDGPPPRQDIVTGASTGSFPNYADTGSRITTVAAAVSRFFGSGSKGSHEVRAGVEYEKATQVVREGYPGGRLYQDRAGAAFRVRVWDGATYRGDHRRTSAYLQDTWSLAEGVTVEAGLRIQVARATPPYAADYASSGIAPRLGVAWEPPGTHAMVLRAHYGRYHDPIVTGYYDFLDPLSQAAAITAEPTGPGADDYRELFRSVPSRALGIDPAVRPSYVDQWVAGAERDLGRRVALRAQYVGRRFADTIGFIDTATVWAPMIVTDPGPDGVAGTGDDAGAITVFNNTNPGEAFRLLTNPPGATRRYDGLQVIATRRGAGAWAAQASYTWSQTRGTYDNFPGTQAGTNDMGRNGVFANPNRALGATGPMSFDITHAVTALGTVHLPWWHGWIVGAVLRFDGGQRWGRTVTVTSGLNQGFESVLVEPRPWRTPAVGLLDVRLEKPWPLGRPGSRLDLYLDVFNLTNVGAATSVVPTSGPRFGLPLTWTSPRSARVGVRYQF